MIARLFSLLALLASATALHAEAYRFNRFGESDGLPTQFIYTLDQAEDGRLLVGTDVGLFAYNGQGFEAVFNGDYRGADFIRCSYPGPEGRFWFGHDQGVVTVLEGNQVHAFPLLEGNASRVNQIVGAGNGSVYVITQADGIFHVTKDFQITRYQGDLAELILYCGAMLDANRMLVGSEFGLQIATFSEAGMEVEWLDELAETAVTHIVWDHGKHLVLATQGEGLWEWDLTKPSGAVQPLLVPELNAARVQVNHVDVHVTGDIFLSTNTHGLIRLFDREGNTFRQTVNFSEEGEMGTQSIQVTFHDRERNLWVGTIGGGLQKLVDHFFAFYDVRLPGEENEAVHDVLVDGDTLWLATDAGIHQTLKTPQHVVHHWHTEHGLPEAGVHQLARDENGDLWAGTKGEGLFVCRAGNQTFEPFFLDKDLLSQQINDILIEGPNIWVATYYGIFQIKRGKVFAHYSTAWGLPHNVVKSLFRDSQGRLWVATHSNDLTYLQDGVQQLRVPEVEGVMDVDCFAEDGQGRIWVGTAGEGTIVVDRGQNHVLRKQDGLYNNNIYALLYDQRGHMWLGHRGGVTRVDANRLLPEAFPQADELFCTPGGMRLGRNGLAWFGTSKGLLRYDPEQDVRNPVEPPVHLLAVNISDSLYNASERIHLDYGDYKIGFEFVGVSFRKNEQVRYKYILEGHDLGWSEITADTRATYTRLGAGEYTFRVTAFNNDGVGGKQERAVRIVIGQPFWAKWWFYVAMLAVAFVSIRFVVMRRESRIKENQEYLKRELAARTREVVEQKELLELKNKDITDSIVYAKNIQRAIIPSPEKIEQEFADSFVFYKPRDIVSGDFYWIDRFGDKVVLACADCTGHGVPGAFMSLISSGILKQVVNLGEVHSPSAALSMIDMELSHMLNQPNSDMSLRDGMDLSMVEYDFRTRRLRMASARRPIIVYQNGERVEVRGDRMSVGGGGEGKKDFTLHTMHLRRGDSIYQFSDGITDQFGGPNGKKLKKQGLLTWLDDLVHLDMRHQGRLLKQQFFSWKGSQSQVDDVLLMGIRV